MSERRTMARASMRALVRGARSAVKGRAPRPVPLSRPAPGGGQVTLTPATGRTSSRSGPSVPHGMQAWTMAASGAEVGQLWTRSDLGTGTFEVLAWCAPGADPALVAAALILVRQCASDDLRLALRVPLDPALRAKAPSADVLTAAGLTRVATFPANPEGPRAWGGEERWDLLGD